MTALADQLQIWGVDEGKIVFSDGSLGFGLKITGVDVSTWDDPRIDKLATQLNTFLNGLPAGIDFQIVQDIEPASAKILEENVKLGERATDPLVQALHHERADALKAEIASGALPQNTLRLFVRRPIPASVFAKPKFFSKPKSFEPIARDVFAREHRAVCHLEAEMSASLINLGIRAAPLSAKEITELVYRQWNPLRQEDLLPYDPEDIRSSLLFTDVAVSEKGFSLGGMHYRLVSLKLMPDCTYASMARALASLPFGSRLFLSVHVPDQQKELEALQTSRRLAFSMARGKREGVSDIESEAKLQDLEALISELVAQGEKVFHASLTIVLKSENDEELRDQVSMAISAIRELSGAEAMEESLAAFDIFSEAAIPNARSRERARRIKTSNLADFLPVFGPWSGFGVPRILLKTRGNELFLMDPFSKELSNYNQIVAGGSGSGKSFLTNILLLQTLKENPKIFVVDIGGSYRKLCDNLSGQYIPFSLNDSFALNPFDLPSGEIVPSSQKIKFLVGLVEMMTREDGAESIGRLERAEIEAAIQLVYDKHPKPKMSHLKELLLKHESPEVRKFGKILGPWCGDSPYGRMIDRETTVSLERTTVCFDLKGLESNPDLQAVCLYLITDYVWREVQKDRNVMKFLVFDECWKLLENASGASFIGEVFRTFRKYFASAIAISQNIDDFAKSRVSQAILPNTSIRWILMQKGADQERLKEVLRLNDTEAALIASLHQRRGEYSEAFLMAEDNRTLVRVAPTPLEYWIATTDPRDLSLIQTESASGKSQLEILRDLSVRFPKGAVASTTKE
jgi:conjugal transfer ATP-binding protein TraC